MFSLHNVQPTLGPTRLPIQWVPEIKRPERDVEHSPDLSMYAFMARKGTVLPFVRYFFYVPVCGGTDCH